MNERARKKLIAARTAMILEQPFFGTLALRLRLVEDPAHPTAWTDGRSLGYNPDFVLSLTHDQLFGLVAHEVMHCACGHPWRRGGRDPRRWNIAADYAINQILQAANIQLPDGALLSGAYKGKSAEWIYDRLPSSMGGNGGNTSDPSAWGEVIDANSGPTGSEGTPAATVTEADWKQAVQQATQAAKMQGRLPDSLERFAGAAARPKADWRSVLRRFVQAAAKSDYTWARPNSRYLSSRLFLPALHNQECGPIAVAVDTSGSIDDVLLGQFAAELQAIMDEARPARIDVIYCDARIHKVESFERDDVITLHAVGGGGTDFRPVFEHLEQSGEPPVCLVYLTDLYGTFPRQAPGYPVLWATITDGARAPFGETVLIE